MGDFLNAMVWLTGYVGIGFAMYRYGQFKTLKQLTDGSDAAEKKLYGLMRQNGYACLLFAGWKVMDGKPGGVQTWCTDGHSAQIKLGNAAARMAGKRVVIESPMEGRA